MKQTGKYYCGLICIHLLMFWMIPFLMPKDDFTAFSIFVAQLAPAYLAANWVPGMIAGKLLLWPTPSGYAIVVLFWATMYGLLASLLTFLAHRLRRLEVSTE